MMLLPIISKRKNISASSEDVPHPQYRQNAQATPPVNKEGWNENQPKYLLLPHLRRENKKYTFLTEKEVSIV